MTKRKKIGMIAKKKRKLIELQRYEGKVKAWDHNYCAEVPESSTCHAEWESASSTMAVCYLPTSLFSQATAKNNSNTSDTVLEELHEVDQKLHVSESLTYDAEREPADMTTVTTTNNSEVSNTVPELLYDLNKVDNELHVEAANQQMGENCITPTEISSSVVVLTHLSYTYPDVVNLGNTESLENARCDFHMNCAEVLRCLQPDIKLPSNWGITSSNGVLQLCQISSNVNPVVQRCIIINVHGTVTVLIHGKELPKDHMFWDRGEKLGGCNNLEIASNISKVVAKLNAYSVCPGNFESAYQNVCTDPSENADSPNGKMCKEGDYGEPDYSSTIRSTNCRLLVLVDKSLCQPCKKQRKMLQMKLYRSNKRDNVPSVTSRRPHSSLKTEQLRSMLKQYAAQSAKLKHQVRNLKKKINTTLWDQVFE